jgi:hypothetical protein
VELEDACPAAPPWPPLSGCPSAPARSLRFRRRRRRRRPRPAAPSAHRHALRAQPRAPVASLHCAPSQQITPSRDTHSDGSMAPLEVLMVSGSPPRPACVAAASTLGPRTAPPVAEPPLTMDAGRDGRVHHRLCRRRCVDVGQEGRRGWLDAVRPAPPRQGGQPGHGGRVGRQVPGHPYVASSTQKHWSAR